MPVQTKEGQIILAIEAIRTLKKLSRRRAAKLYNVPESSLRDQINGITPQAEKRNTRHTLTSSKEETLVQHILDLDSQGFSPWIDSIRDIANLLLAMHQATPIGKL